ncbi:N-acetylglucosamine kinase-like BadF-type ATPase [Friedmanniella endophytica]|uniref:N-acetylglucosamine kinase-like BadF-type ATPase n=1 Tax=Microlunatus kandeliicorticis TaxID=1759536 RepID=A0A7W3IPG4_9ACTN|nr:BadF/BadG/BcrA/BcrD ATPase family protein [Microlunatus kandeliicorticis]MBA8792814.1 N-acetylglucosamine kinase-like BadF-type ATPase [Microlunatus kandeliicorticis]
MTDRALHLGVDAGNSKTVALVADDTGRVLGRGRSGNGDIYGAGERAATRAVAEAVAAALTGADSPPDGAGLVSAAFCLAGVDYDDDHAFWHAELADRMPGLGARYTLLNDGFALLRAGAPDGLGVALSAGTGAAAVARGPAGPDGAVPEWSASFWIVGRFGGTDLGSAAVDAVISAELGLAPTTALTARVLERWDYPDVATLLERTTRRGADRRSRPALARDVLAAAAEGDAVARAIVLDQAERIAGYGVAARDRVGLSAPFPVVLGGSVLSSDHGLLREATVEALGRRLPGCPVVATHRSPVLGALAESYARVGRLDADVLAELDRQVFPPDFLLT